MKFDNRPNRLLIDLYRKSIFIDGNRLKMVPDTFELRISNNIERGFQKSRYELVFELAYRFIPNTVNCFLYTLEHCRLRESKKKKTWLHILLYLEGVSFDSNAA